MATMPKVRKTTFRPLVFWGLVGLGCVRCLYDLLFFPEQLRYVSWLAPRPQVFVESHYLWMKHMHLKYASGEVVRLDLSSASEWPLSGFPLVSYYTLVHCLDRPQLMRRELCLPIIRRHFCDSEYRFSRVKPELLGPSLQAVSVYSGQAEPLAERLRVECQ